MEEALEQKLDELISEISELNSTMGKIVEALDGIKTAFQK